jgi:hypothetical protein
MDKTFGGLAWSIRSILCLRVALHQEKSRRAFWLSPPILCVFPFSSSCGAGKTPLTTTTKVLLPAETTGAIVIIAKKSTAAVSIDI